MNVWWHAVPGDRAGKIETTLAKLCSGPSGTGFNIGISVDGSKSLPCTGFCSCGNAGKDRTDQALVSMDYVPERAGNWILLWVHAADDNDDDYD